MADTVLRWVGAFNAVSAFNNNGMMLLDANMVRHSAMQSCQWLTASERLLFKLQIIC